MISRGIRRIEICPKCHEPTVKVVTPAPLKMKWFRDQWLWLRCDPCGWVPKRELFSPREIRSYIKFREQSTQDMLWQADKLEFQIDRQIEDECIRMRVALDNGKIQPKDFVRGG